MTQYECILEIWKAKDQLEVARIYAKYIAVLQGTGRIDDVHLLNLEVARKYPSKSGLRRVKELAWKIYEGKVT